MTWQLVLVGVGLAVLLPVVPFSLEMLALRRLTTAAFGTLMSLEPAIALVIGLVVLHQVPGPLAGARRRRSWWPPASAPSAPAPGRSARLTTYAGTTRRRSERWPPDMSARFEELDWRETPMGAISLRRRREPQLGVDVFEAKLDDDFLMSSLFVVAEVELARLGLAALPGERLDVLVGGLGLGYTAVTALEDPRVGSLVVARGAPARWSAGTSGGCCRCRPG